MRELLRYLIKKSEGDSQSSSAKLDLLLQQEIAFCEDLEVTLEDQLDQVSDENRHDEIDTGPPVGHEIW